MVDEVRTAREHGDWMMMIDLTLYMNHGVNR